MKVYNMTIPAKLNTAHAIVYDTQIVYYHVYLACLLIQVSCYCEMGKC